MKKTGYIVAVMALLFAVPALAQGPFTDVPMDHWAYDAINQLQEDGIIIGYPDGTFQGKRAITRYEFAAAIARILPLIPGAMESPKGFVTRVELDDALKGYAKKSDIPDISKLATKADLDNLRKLMDEFRDELAALGVDVDALKRDVACLAARVEALEAEQRRVKITGDVNVFAIATHSNESTAVPYDLDNRRINNTRDTFGKSVSVVRDFDLNIAGRVSDTVSAVSTINYGNYLNYVRYVDDFIDGTRPVNKNDFQGFGGDDKEFVDGFFPYFLYVDAALGKGNMVAGRFPLQLTPYTLKMIDVDVYTTNSKTDSGNYPVDGIMAGYNFGWVDLTLFAAKHDLNEYLLNGLTGQPGADAFAAGANIMQPFHVLGGSAVGGLQNIITQSAGVRGEIGTPWNGKLGLTFYQAFSADETVVGADEYDQARVYGGDLTIPIGCNFNFSGSYTQSDTLAAEGSAAADIDEENAAWDARLGMGWGKLGVGVGYKDIDPNFAAAGYWDKIGRWTNPVNVRGPYAALTYPILSNLNFNFNGEFLTVKDTVASNTRLVEDDEVLALEGGLNWAFSRKNSVGVNYEWVRFSPDAAGSEAEETYLTFGLAHQMNPNAFIKVGYQFIKYTGGTSAASPTFAYGAADYDGGLGVVQLGVSF